MGISTDEKPKEAPKEVPATSSSAESGSRPPSYTHANAEEDILVQLPKLSLGESAAVPSSSTVSRDQCVAHLKFLATLADLRDFVSNQDGLFGLHDSDADKFPKADKEATTPSPSYEEAMARIREKRWAVYTARAVDRYEKWWFAALPKSGEPVTLADQESATYEAITDCFTKVLWTPQNLPPLGKFEPFKCHAGIF